MTFQAPWRVPAYRLRLIGRREVPAGPVAVPIRWHVSFVERSELEAGTRAPGGKAGPCSRPEPSSQKVGFGAPFRGKWVGNMLFQTSLFVVSQSTTRSARRPRRYSARERYS